MRINLNAIILRTLALITYDEANIIYLLIYFVRDQCQFSVAKQSGMLCSGNANRSKCDHCHDDSRYKCVMAGVMYGARGSEILVPEYDREM